MFKKIILAAAVATLAANISVSTASAMGGGGGAPRDAFVTLHNKDGSSKTIRKCHKCGKKRIIHRNRKGKVVKTRRVPNRSVPWAHNHTTGVTSIGVAPRVHVIIGPFGISLGH